MQSNNQPKSQPHILYFSLSRLEVGGAETHILQLLDHLRGYQLSVAGVLSKRFQQVAEQRNVSVYPLPPVSKYNLSAVWRYIFLFRNLKVDIIHTQDTRGGVLGRIAGRLAGCKVVHTLHISSLFWKKQGLGFWVHRIVDTFLAKLTHQTIFVAHPIYQWYCDTGIVSERRACYIPNGIDSTPFALAQQTKEINISRLREKWQIAPDEAVILFAGRFTFQKGLDILVLAFQKIADNFPKARLVLVGDGPEREKLEQQIVQLSLQKRVLITGFRPNIEVIDWLLSSTMLVLPSRFECLPYILIEATAAGLPRIASRVGGNIDLIQDGETGLLVEPGNVESLAHALTRLLADVGLRQQLGHQALFIAQEYSVEKMVAQTTQVYQELLSS